MLELKKSITICAPTEQVFRFVANPANLTCFWPNVIQINDIASLSRLGSRFTWSYRMMGTRFEGFSQIMDYEYARRIIYTTRGGLRSTIKWTFSPLPGGTVVVLHISYRAPAPLLGRLTRTAVERQNESDVETALNNLAAVFKIAHLPAHAT